MAKVTIVLEDAFKDGKPVVSVQFNSDRQGQPENAPATDAMMHGLCIARFWQSRALANMMPHVCADALAKRAELRQLLANLGETSPPPAPPQAPADGAPSDFEKMASGA